MNITQLIFLENRRKIEPNKIHSCWIPYLFVLLAQHLKFLWALKFESYSLTSFSCTKFASCQSFVKCWWQLLYFSFFFFLLQMSMFVLPNFNLRNSYLIMKILVRVIVLTFHVYYTCNMLFWLTCKQFCQLNLVSLQSCFDCFPLSPGWTDKQLHHFCTWWHDDVKHQILFPDRFLF